jgi:hypothetical protein
MLPAILDPATASPGEREVFRRLQKDPLTADWIVLHSLDISHHVRGLAGEVDFLALVPGKGVLVLEVKACRSLKRADGLWFYGQQESGDPRGPFKQAAEAMYSVRSHLDRHADLRAVPFFSAVLLPYIHFSERSDEWHSWQVIDAAGFSSKPLSELLISVLDSGRRFLSKQSAAGWFKPDRHEPTERQCRVIVKLLRPDFESVQTPGQLRTQREDELRSFTEEQFEALDALEANPRVVFEGAAGTGKTFLAIEAARRAVNEGSRALFLCFNAMLGEWLRDQVREFGPRITARTIHGYMLQISDAKPGQGEEFWADQLPARVIERLIEDESFDAFDELIVDEAQDILRPGYLDVLDLSLRGGLAAGTWRFFGDFERQAIYKTASMGVEDFCAQRGGRPARFKLTVNCRNAPRIVELIRVLARLDAGYSKILRPDSGVEPRIRLYGSEEDECGLLAEALSELYESGLEGHDIVVLSPVASNSCAERITDAPWADRLASARDAAAGQIPYTTIHAFKGDGHRSSLGPCSRNALLHGYHARDRSAGDPGQRGSTGTSEGARSWHSTRDGGLT